MSSQGHQSAIAREVAGHCVSSGEQGVLDLGGILAAPDPYPVYASLRRAAPLLRAEVGGEEAWVATRYEDCLALLADPRFETEGDPLFLDASGEGGPGRRSVGPLAPRTAERLGPRMVEAVIGLLERAETRREIDLVNDFASPAAVVGPCELLGVAREDRELLAVWAAEPEARAAADEALQIYFEEHVHRRRRAPRDDLSSAAILAGGETDPDDAVLVARCVALLRGGHALCAALLASGARALARDPAVRRRPGLRPRTAVAWVEECARWDPPVHLTARTAARELWFCGARLAAGERVWALLGSANRDPEFFERPEAFRISRRDPPHLSFGFGAHVAWGAHLARVTARIGLCLLAQRFPRLVLAGAAVPGPSGAVRTWTRIPAGVGR